MRPFRSLRLAPIVFALALAVGLAAFPVRLSALPLAGKAGFFADLYPVFGGTNDPAIGSGRGTMTAEEFRDFTARPAILTLGFSLEQGPFFACMGMELQQEAAAYLGLQHGNNLPLNGSGDGL